MNSRREYNRSHIPRLMVEPVDHEKEKEDLAISERTMEELRVLDKDWEERRVEDQMR